jgi:hypothetical protein
MSSGWTPQARLTSVNINRCSAVSRWLPRFQACCTPISRRLRQYKTYVYLQPRAIGWLRLAACVAPLHILYHKGARVRLMLRDV